MIFGASGINTNGQDEFTIEEEALLTEAMLLDAGPDVVEELLESNAQVDSLLQQEVLMERSIVRLDKNAKINRAYWTAIFNIARKKKDSKYKKLVTLWKMEKQIEKYLEKKYGNEARRIAKKSVNKKANSTNKAVSTATAKAKTMFNKPVNVKR